jgi:hypothetical protein
VANIIALWAFTSCNFAHSESSFSRSTGWLYRLHSTSTTIVRAAQNSELCDRIELIIASSAA